MSALTSSHNHHNSDITSGHRNLRNRHITNHFTCIMPCLMPHLPLTQVGYEGELGLLGVCGCKNHSHPSTLLLGAVSMAVQAGKDRPWGHEFTRLVPAMSVANACGIILTLPVQDRVQPVSDKQNEVT